MRRRRTVVSVRREITRRRDGVIRCVEEEWGELGEVEAQENLNREDDFDYGFKVL